MGVIERTCEWCGKPFTVKESRLKHGRGKTCSLQCSYESRGMNVRTPPIEALCARCGKPFSTTTYRLAQGHRYCSVTCAKPPTYTICKGCGKRFRHSPSHPRIYCSKACADHSSAGRQVRRARVKVAWETPEKRQHMMYGIQRRSDSPTWRNAPHFQRGALHPRYRGNRKARQEASQYEYKVWRRDVLRKDNFTCQVCHVRGGRLTAHHIQAWAEHPALRFDVDNGMAVCEPCHLKLHGLTRRERYRYCADCGKWKSSTRCARCRSCARRMRK